LPSPDFVDQPGAARLQSAGPAPDDAAPVSEPLQAGTIAGELKKAVHAVDIAARGGTDGRPTLLLMPCPIPAAMLRKNRTPSVIASPAGQDDTGAGLRKQSQDPSLTTLNSRPCWNGSSVRSRTMTARHMDRSGPRAERYSKQSSSSSVATKPPGPPTVGTSRAPATRVNANTPRDTGGACDARQRGALYSAPPKP
jgi:hypothetical protein